MGRKRIQIGDVFEMPLSDGRVAYGQYVFLDEKMGPLIRVFDLFTRGEVPWEQLVDQLQSAGLLFPPVITGLFAAIRAGFWKIIGHMPTGEFTYPGFISTMHESYKQLSDWYLWDGKESVRLGRELPARYKHMEFLAGWDPHGVVHRIETGENPYDKLIRGPQ